MSVLFYATLAEEMARVEGDGVEGDVVLGTTVMGASVPVYGEAVKAGRSLELLTVAVYEVREEMLAGESLAPGTTASQFVYSGWIPASALRLVSLRRLTEKEPAKK